MDMTSAAEANLNARVRPQIVALRAKTPYPKQRAEGAAAVAVSGPRPVLSLVGAGSAAAGPVPEAAVRLSVVKLSAAEAPVAGRPVAGRPAAAARPGARTPIKLTRRGRVVVGLLIGLAVAAVALLIGFAVAGPAQASSHVGPRVPASDSVSRVVVRAGQTLWGIAAKADPSADPRAIIGEIIDLNSLNGTTIQVGQVLLVPKG